MVVFKPRPVSFIRITGTHNTANEVFHCVHFECPCDSQVLGRYLENNNLSMAQLNLNDNVATNINTNSKQTRLNTQNVQPMMVYNANVISGLGGGGGGGSVTSSLASNNSNSISSSLNSTFSTHIHNMNSAGANINNMTQQQQQLQQQPAITISLTGSSENLTRILDDDDNQTVSTYSEMGDN